MDFLKTVNDGVSLTVGQMMLLVMSPHGENESGLNN